MLDTPEYNFNLFNEIATRLSKWKEFGRLLDLDEHVIDIIEADHPTCYERVYQCMKTKNGMSEEKCLKLDWMYWKSKLKQLDNEGLNAIKYFEDKYPILQDDIPQPKVGHICSEDGCGIFMHDALRPGHFSTKSIDQDTKVLINYGGGTYLWKTKREITTNLQAIYCQTYPILVKSKVIDFSEKAVYKECTVLRGLSQWQVANNDNGFSIKGYDVGKHFHLFTNDDVCTDDYSNNESDSCITTYLEKENTILHIEIATNNLKESWQNNNQKVKQFRSLHKKSIINKGIVHIPLLLYDPISHANQIKELCKECVSEYKIVAPLNIFEDLNLIQEWFDKVKVNLRTLKYEINEKGSVSTVGVSETLLSNIVAFLGLVKSNLPTYGNNPETKMQKLELTKLILLSSEQLEIRYSNHKLIVIKGCHGSGKTVVSQERIRILIRNSKPHELVYYLCHDPNSLFLEEMKTTFEEEISNKKIIVDSSNNLVRKDNKLSSIINFLVKKHPDRVVHLVIDEFNGESIDDIEVSNIKSALSSFNNSHVILVAQSMESQRCKITAKQRLEYEKYQYQKLKEEVKFHIYDLSYLFRSSKCIHELVSVAISNLNKVKIQSTVPYLDHKTSKLVDIIQQGGSNESQSENTVERNEKPEIDSNESQYEDTEEKNEKHGDDSNEKQFENTVERNEKNGNYSNENQSENTEESNIVDNIPIDISNVQQTRKDAMIIESLSDDITLKTNKIADTDEILRDCTFNSNEEDINHKIESQYKYIGVRTLAHNIEGNLPIIYYPFTKKVCGQTCFDKKKIFHLTLLLKEIISVKVKSVILCFNEESYDFLYAALNVVNIDHLKWTSNKYKFYHEDYHVLITYYSLIRGCEFLNVILVYPTNESHLKQNLIGCLNRCSINLKLIVLDNFDKQDYTMMKILEEWEAQKLVCSYRLYAVDESLFYWEYNDIRDFTYAIIKHLSTYKDYLKFEDKFGSTLRRSTKDSSKQNKLDVLKQRGYNLEGNEKDKKNDEDGKVEDEKKYDKAEVPPSHALDLEENKKDPKNDDDGTVEEEKKYDKAEVPPSHALDTLGPDIFEVIYQRIRNWRRFGRLIGIEEYELDNIEIDCAKKEDRLHRCILFKEESRGYPIEWGFLKKAILKFKEGGEIVIALENAFPFLQTSRNEKNNDEVYYVEADKYMFIDILDIISTRLQDWKRLAKVLHIEYISIDIEGYEKYRDHLEEKVYRCINEKIISTPEIPDWFYWRKILLKLNEIDLVDDIEEKYPDLLQDKRIDISDVSHLAYKEFGILAHNAMRTEYFEKLPVKLKDRIKVCVGGGKEKMFQIKNTKIIQDNYFNKYECVEKIKMYNFTSFVNFTECKILKTLHQWLQKNEDYGFCIKGYDAKRHLEFITDDYFNKNPKESYILAYSKKHGCIFFIDTEPIDIKTSLRENRSNIRPIRTANQCLDDASFVFIPLTLYDPNKHEIDEKICRACIDLQLVVSAETFKNLDSFEKWWEKFSNEVDYIKSGLEEKADASNGFFRSIMTYMAFDSFLLPSFAINPEVEIKEMQKLIMLTPEQLNIVYSLKRHKVIKGSFGTGKTVVAQKILKLVANNSKGLETTYYIMHDSDSGFVKEMEKLAIALNKENVTACKRSDLVKNTNSLSSILEYLLAINKGKIIHVFIEEFDGEMLDRSEVEKIKILLENEEFKNSHIVIVAQSMASERREFDDAFQIKSLETYNYKKLVEETDFEILHLSYMLRSSKYINDIVNVAIPILEEAKIKSTIPNFNSGLSFSSDDPTTSSNTRNLNNVLKEDENLTHTSKVTKSQKDKHDEIYKQESKIEDSDIITSFDDTSKFLKHCTISAGKYSSKREIESNYTYVGKKKLAHNVKGNQPVIYYPFKKETKEFVHQIFCLAEVLKVILDDKKEQVIICLNMKSMNMVKGALDVYNIKWTNDFELLSTSVCLLTEYTAVRGYEFLNVVLILPIDEQYLKQNLVACINSCIFDLKFIVFNYGIPDDDLVRILLEWINAGLVMVSNEDYLKNANKLKRFIEINGDTLNSRYQNENMDINDPSDSWISRVIQKLKSIGL